MFLRIYLLTYLSLQRRMSGSSLISED